MSTGFSINSATGLGMSSAVLGNVNSAAAVSMGAVGMGKPAKASESAPKPSTNATTNVTETNFSITDRNTLLMIGVAMIGAYIVYNSMKS